MLDTSFYSKHFDLLVKELLSSGHFEADCEDAVETAFLKLMPDATQLYLNSEAELHKKLYWQAKSYLSHLAKHRDTFKMYHKKATEEGYLGQTKVTCCRIDKLISNKALKDTLLELCRENGVKEQNLVAYIRWNLFGESSRNIEKELGIKMNNLHRIRWCIENLLSRKGKDRYLSLKRKYFLQAS